MERAWQNESVSETDCLIGVTVFMLSDAKLLIKLLIISNLFTKHQSPECKRGCVIITLC